MRDFAFDDLTRFGFGSLFGEGDAFAGFDEFGDVAGGGVVGNASHGNVVAFGEGDVENGGGDFSVLKKHLIEITQAIEEKDVVREGTTDGLVLSHHGGEFFLGGHGKFLEQEIRRRKEPW